MSTEAMIQLVERWQHMDKFDVVRELIQFEFETKQEAVARYIEILTGNLSK